jgi:hypothetical protein
VNLHPLDPSVMCRHCGKGDLVFVRTRNRRDLYRCVAEIPCKSSTVHSRQGKVCGIGAEFGLGYSLSWSECAVRELAKGRDDK